MSNRHFGTKSSDQIPQRKGFPKIDFNTGPQRGSCFNTGPYIASLLFGAGLEAKSHAI